MKIKIKTREYLATRDHNGWELQIPKIVIDKETKKEKIGYRSVYYTRFDHVLQSIMDRECSHCETLQEVKEMIYNFPTPK